MRCECGRQSAQSELQLNRTMSIDHSSLQRVKAELGIQLPEEYEQLVQIFRQTSPTPRSLISQLTRSG